MLKRPQEIACCHARGWAHSPSCHDGCLDPGTSPECLPSIRKNLQLQVQGRRFTSLGWREHKELGEEQRGLGWGSGTCSEQQVLFVLFLDTDVNSSL